ncbi:variable surface lipoprotein [Mycoplasmopsis bovis]|nr:variable surface lipoprotein [Mycoplasmopsis bovis]
MKKSKILILGSIASLSNYIMIAAKCDVKWKPK